MTDAVALQGVFVTPEELYKMFEQKFDKLFEEVRAVGDRLTRVEAKLQSSSDTLQHLSDGQTGSLIRIGVLETQVQVYQERLKNQGDELGRQAAEIKKLSEFRWMALGLAAGVSGLVSIAAWLIERL